MPTSDSLHGLTGDQILKMRAMVEAGFTQAGIAQAYGLSLMTVRRFVLEMRQDRPAAKKRHRTRDVELRDISIGGSGEPYFCTTGSTDQYLERLHRIHPEKAP